MFIIKPINKYKKNPKKILVIGSSYTSKCNMLKKKKSCIYNCCVGCMPSCLDTRCIFAIFFNKIFFVKHLSHCFFFFNFV